MKRGVRRGRCSWFRLSASLSGACCALSSLALWGTTSDEDVVALRELIADRVSSKLPAEGVLPGRNQSSEGLLLSASGVDTASTGVPSFAFSPLMQQHDPKASNPSFQASEFDEAFVQPLRGHAMEVAEASAAFCLMCCLHHERFDKNAQLVFDRLPLRSPQRPYLVFVLGLEIRNEKQAEVPKRLLSERKDFLYMNFDLRGYRPWTDFAKRLPGVTLAPPLFYKGPAPDLGRPPKYFLTFRGSLRKGLKGDFNSRAIMSHIGKRLGREDVVIEWTDFPLSDAKQGGLGRLKKRDFERYAELMDTAYVLMLRGVERWTYRFSEAVGACAIPVLFTDGRGSGLTLPYEELIDWNAASVQIGEKLGFKTEPHLLRYLNKTPRALLEHIPSDPQTILEMRRRVCEINDKYFATAAKRAEAALRSAAIVARRTYDRSLLVGPDAVKAEDDAMSTAKAQDRLLLVKTGVLPA